MLAARVILGGAIIVPPYVYDDKRDAESAPNRESGATRLALTSDGYTVSD